MPTDNPERDWGRPSYPATPPGKKSVRDEDSGCWLFTLMLAGGFALTLVALCTVGAVAVSNV